MANHFPDEISRSEALKHFRNVRREELEIALQRFVQAAARAEHVRAPSPAVQEQFNDNLEEWIASMAAAAILDHGRL